MSLSENILRGIQRWQQSVVKNYSRSRGRRRATLGKQLQALSCPKTLGEARKNLEQLLLLLPATEKKRVRELLQAVESAESREGVDTESLVSSLLEGEISLGESVERRLGYLLCPELSA